MVEDTDAERSDDASDVVSVLNAFAYTCGAGVVAADAGAGRVVNTDHSASYLAYGDANAKLNGVPKMDSLCCDFYPAMRQMAGLAMPGRKEMGRGGRGGGRGGRFGGRGGRGRSDGKNKNNSNAAPAKIEPETFDLVILDPPTLTKTRFGAVDIENDYPSLAKPSALCVKPGGVLLATNHSAAVGLDDWLEIVSRCATKAGREVVSVDVIEPDGADDDDFPPLDDGKRPLKVAAFTLA
jgi:23S rRNA (cytosine1962-C5)-methyltransferase